jgi:hypothetical protein
MNVKVPYPALPVEGIFGKFWIRTLKERFKEGTQYDELQGYAASGYQTPPFYRVAVGNLS